MKYLVTNVYVSRTGGHVFNPAMDSEVFDCYFSALKWLYQEINVDRGIGWNVEVEFFEERFCYGRQEMVHVLVSTGHSFTHYYLSKISMNGFH